MKKYEHGRIDRLYNSLEAHGVAENIISEILEGGENIKQSDKPEIKTEWMKNAMKKMDRLLPEKERIIIREDCACCMGGKRLQLSKNIAKAYDSLDDRITAADKTGYVFGKGVKKEADGTLTVSFFDDNLDSYSCVCLKRPDGPISETYCYCCGGHIKHHLQIALDRRLSCKVISSALSSGGTKNCKFSYTILD